MITLELIPQKGIAFIQFGMPRATVQQIMQQTYGVQVDAAYKDYYFENCLQFNYQEDTLSFIEVAIGHPPPFQLRLFETAIHRISAKRLVNLIEQKDTLDSTLSTENSLFFTNTRITLWRRFTGKKWEAIGIGDHRYYKEMKALEEA